MFKDKLKIFICLCLGLLFLSIRGFKFAEKDRINFHI